MGRHTLRKVTVQLISDVVDALQSGGSIGPSAVAVTEMLAVFQVWKLGSQRLAATPLQPSAVTGRRPSVFPAVPLKADVGVVPGSPNVTAYGNAGLAAEVPQ